jgi:hypothetical protein
MKRNLIYLIHKDNLDSFNPDFPLRLEMATLNSLMDFLCNFEGNSHSIDRKFA